MNDLLSKVKRKTKRQKFIDNPLTVKQIVIDGQLYDVPVYGESVSRPKTQMRLKGEQTHDAKIR